MILKPHAPVHDASNSNTRVEVIATRDRGQQDVKVTEGLFTFVALDEQHKPRALPEV